MSAMGRPWLEIPRSLRRLAGWPRQDRQLFFEAARLAFCVEFDLRIVPFTRVLAKLNAPPDGRSGANSPVSAASVLRAIERAYRVLPFKSTCLRESLIFCRIFKWRALPAELRVGVKKTGGLLGAHAWVEDGRGVVLTDALEHFLPLPLPGPRSRTSSADDV